MGEDVKPLDRLKMVELHRDQHREMILQLRSDIEKLKKQEPLEAVLQVSSTPTTWTERTLLTSTVKDGFRVGEATLSCTYEEGNAPSDQEIRDRLSRVLQNGQEVATQKNHDKQQLERFTNT